MVMSWTVPAEKLVTHLLTVASIQLGRKERLKITQVLDLFREI